MAVDYCFLWVLHEDRETKAGYTLLSACCTVIAAVLNTGGERGHIHYVADFGGGDSANLCVGLQNVKGP